MTKKIFFLFFSTEHISTARFVIREDNPAKFIQLKDGKTRKLVVQNRLLSNEEIQEFWQYFLTKKYRFPILRNRNIVMVSLLLFQALRSGEIKRLQLEDIDLENTQIFIEKSHNTRARTLALEPCQILPFYQYIYQDRTTLLPYLSTENTLFINKLGKVEKGETLHYLLESNRHVLQGKTINPKTVRMSVLTQQFKQGKSLQEVQYFAGHRDPSSTERYKTNHLDTLQEVVLRHHPLS